MSMDAGSISSRLTLDTSGYDAPLARSLSSTRQIAEYAIPALDKASNNVGRSLAGVGESLKQTTTHTGGLGNALKALGGTAAGVVPSLGQLATAAAGIGTAFIAARAAASLGDFVTDTIKLAAANEDLAVSFRVMLGSAADAKRLMSEIQRFAAATPFESGEITDAARALISYGSTAGGVIGELRSLGDVASGVGMRLGDLAEIYGKLRSRGRAELEDINQLAGRGIPIIKALSAQMSVAESEVGGVVSAGKVGFNEVAAALRSMSESGGLFFGMMEERSKTLNGKLSSLSDAWTDVKRSIGAAIAEELGLTGAVDETTAAVERLRGPAVELASSVARIAATIGPAMAEAAAHAATIIEALAGIDKYKPGESPYAPTAPGKASDMPADAAGITKLQEAFNLYAEARKQTYLGLEAIENRPPADFALRTNAPGFLETIDQQKSAAEAMNEQVKAAYLRLDAMREKAAKGGTIDQAEFKSIAATIDTMIANTNAMRESQLRAIQAISAAPLVPDDFKQLVGDVSDQTRELLAAAEKRLGRRRQADTQSTAAAVPERTGTEADFFATDDKPAGKPGSATGAAVAAAKTTADAQADAARSTADAWTAAEAARLRATGRTAEAVALLDRAAWNERIANAKTAEEKTALEAQRAEEQKEKAADAKQRLIADNLFAARQTQLDAAGENEQAARERLTREWDQTINETTDADVKRSLIVRRNAELEALAVEQAERRKRDARNTTAAVVPPTTSQLAENVRSSTTTTTRAYNRLALRERRFGLNEDEQERMDRLREMTGQIPAAAAEVAGRLRRPSSGSFDDTAGDGTDGPATRRGGAGGATVNAPVSVNLDASQLAREVIGVVVPVIHSEVAQAMAAVRGEVVAMVRRGQVGQG